MKFSLWNAEFDCSTVSEKDMESNRKLQAVVAAAFNRIEIWDLVVGTFTETGDSYVLKAKSNYVLPPGEEDHGVYSLAKCNECGWPIPAHSSGCSMTVVSDVHDS